MWRWAIVISIKDLRMQLTENDIKNLLAKYGVFSQAENDSTIIFPTACHNLENGSPKLYYYKKDKIFKCYTECNKMFDIFELIIKMKRLRGREINLREAIGTTGLEQNMEVPAEILADLEYLHRLKNANNLTENEKEDAKILDKKIIDGFSFNLQGLKPWIAEGISIDTLKKYNIRYDQVANAIIIPNLNHEGELVGIRGRFFNKDAIAKYMPIRYNGVFLSHPTGKYLYGFYENEEIIRKKRVAIIFEGEKSVMKMDTLFPDFCVALSTSGKKITLEQQSALIKLNLHEVVLAYDKDYTNAEERKEKLKEYEQVIKMIEPYCKTSIIMDYNDYLGYKDSPIDRGREIFEKLMKERIKR